MKKRAYIIIAVIAILSLSITAGALFFSGTPTAKNIPLRIVRHTLSSRKIAPLNLIILF